MTKNGSSIHKNLFIHVKTYFLYSKKKFQKTIFFLLKYIYIPIYEGCFFFQFNFFENYNNSFIRMTLGTKTKEKTLLIFLFDSFTCCSIQSVVSAYTVFHIKKFHFSFEFNWYDLHSKRKNSTNLLWRCLLNCFWVSKKRVKFFCHNCIDIIERCM